MPITFLHAADVHLDSPMRGLERYDLAPVDRIRGATRRAFENLVNLAIERQVDFVLIAGDLYDGDWLDFQTGLHLGMQLGRLRDHGIPVVMIAGNHDAANKMTRSLRLPPNVKMLGHDRPHTHRLDDLEISIHGQSFARQAVVENLAASYPRADAAGLHIGLLHTSLAGAAGHETYAPCSPDDLRSREYDYWALGHVHTRQDPCADPRIAFSGNLQGRHVREDGAKGCLLVTLDGTGVQREFHRLDTVRWERLEVDLRRAETESAVLDQINAALLKLVASEAGSDRLIAARVVLRGATPWHDRLHVEAERFENEVRSLAQDRGAERLWVERTEVRTTPPAVRPSFDGPIEELREVIAELRGDPASLIALSAEWSDLTKKLPSEFLGDNDAPRLDDPAWLAELLDRAQPLLLELIDPRGRDDLP